MSATYGRERTDGAPQTMNKASEFCTDDRGRASAPETLTISRAELANGLSISVRTLRRWETMKIGPPPIRIGRIVRYRMSAVDEWLRQAEATAFIGPHHEDGALNATPVAQK